MRLKYYVPGNHCKVFVAKAFGISTVVKKLKVDMNINNKGLQQKLIIPYRDLFVISVAAVVVLIAVYFDIFEIMTRWRTGVEKYKLDEIIPVLLILAIAFGVFSFRRWRELTKEITQNRSQEAETRLLAQTVLSAKDCICIADLNDTIMFVNDAFIQLYGYSQEELAGQNISIVRSPGMSAEITKQIRPATLTGEWYGELINRRKDGSEFPIELWASLVKDDSGEPVATVGISRDITQRKQAEEDLRRKERQQALVLQSLPMVFYTGKVTPDLETVWISEQVEQITGFPPEKFTGDTMFWQTRLHSDDQERVINEYYSVVEKEYIHTEYRWLCANGMYRWFSDHIVLIRDEQGKPKEIVGIWRDTTVQKLAEEELKDREEQLQLTVKAGNVGLWDWDLNSNRVFFSSEWKNQIGYRDDEIPSHYEEWESRLHPDDLEPTLAKLKTTLAVPYPPYNLEFRLHHKDGSYRWILAQGSLSFNPQGQPTRMLGSHIDITGRKQAEAERERIIGELQEALDNIKTLSGLLPICANCKKIRDDSGYWNQLEKYIVDHTTAKFTHGICPECAAKYLKGIK